jgi:hypothetical protein
MDLTSDIKKRIATAILPIHSIDDLKEDKLVGSVSHRNALFGCDSAWTYRYVHSNLSLRSELATASPIVVVRETPESQSTVSDETVPNIFSEISTDLENPNDVIVAEQKLVEDFLQVNSKEPMIQMNMPIETSIDLLPEEKETFDFEGDDDVIDISVGLPEAEVLHIASEEIVVTQPVKAEPSKIAKHKKRKKNKFKLADHSGISPYNMWLLSLKDANFEANLLKQEEKARKKRIEAEAKKSVTKSDLIISESLADLLAAQGHHEEAKKMYAQLMMKYPQKSSYFAAKINNK